ncbi:MAG TPA: Sec-independent protein translocase protein TatB [Motilibacterales bacterium]|nr:Sec-independent protein translocase protein TatB [Motilibacterales bacterium]
MPDIGFGEIIVMVVLALLVFGPERLPKMAADAARTLRQVRQMAAAARKDLVDASGMRDDEEMAQVVRDLKDLDPRRAMQDALTDDPATGGRAAGQRVSGGAKGGTARPASNDPAVPKAAGSAPTEQTPASGPLPGPGPGPSPSSSSVPAMGAGPVAPPVVAPAPVDPDWT